MAILCTSQVKSDQVRTGKIKSEQLVTGWGRSEQAPLPSFHFGSRGALGCFFFVFLNVHVVSYPCGLTRLQGERQHSGRAGAGAGAGAGAKHARRVGWRLVAGFWLEIWPGAQPGILVEIQPAIHLHTQSSHQPKIYLETPVGVSLIMRTNDRPDLCNQAFGQ